MVPNNSKDIPKGSRVLAIPGGLSDGNLPIWVQGLPKEGHQAVEAKEQRRRTLNGQVGPLALRLEAQMPMRSRRWRLSSNGDQRARLSNGTEVTPVPRHAVVAVAQGRSDCSASLSQQSTSEQDHQFSPGGSSKQGTKSHQNL